MSAAFKIGDTVMYSTNGICTVSDIQKMTFPMETKERTYYVLRPASNRNATLFVPDDNAELVGKMRYILPKDEIDDIISGAVGETIDWIDERNARNNAFSTILKNGDPRELLLLLRCILKRKSQLAEVNRRLSNADETTLMSAEKLVCEEFAFSLGISRDEIVDYLKAKMGENE